MNVATMEDSNKLAIKRIKQQHYQSYLSYCDFSSEITGSPEYELITTSFQKLD
jgi:hypothetical protein